jgi:hypothetical protein
VFLSTITLEERGEAVTEVTMRALFNTTSQRDAVIERHGADECGRETLGRLAAHVESRRRRERVGRVTADQSVSLDGSGAGSNVGMGNGMGDGGDGLHTWIFAEGGRTGRNSAAIEGPQKPLAGAGSGSSRATGTWSSSQGRPRAAWMHGHLRERTSS